MRVKKILNQVSVSKQEICSRIDLSRPTFDSYIRKYECGELIPKERYQIIFDRLFGDDSIDRDSFLEILESVQSLLERDKALGTGEIDPICADLASIIKEKMIEDMKKKDYSLDVYIFIDLLLSDYREQAIFRRFAEYFVFLNRSDNKTEVDDEKKPCFSQFFKCFRHVLDDPGDLDEDSYNRLICRRNELFRIREGRRLNRNKEIEDLINKSMEEIEKLGVVATKEQIIQKVLSEMRHSNAEATGSEENKKKGE